MSKKHNHNHESEPPPLTPKGLRLQNMAQYGTLDAPEQTEVDPEALAAGLAMCASAGLPEPLVVESTYVFVHFRVPGLQFRCPTADIAENPERVVQICKSAGIRTDALEALDDPPVAA